VSEQCTAPEKNNTEKATHSKKKEMSFLLNQCPDQIQTVTVELQDTTQEGQQRGERGKENGV